MSRPLTPDELRAEREAYEGRVDKRLEEEDAEIAARNERLGITEAKSDKRNGPFKRDFVVGSKPADVDYRPTNDFDVNWRGR